MIPEWLIWAGHLLEGGGSVAAITLAWKVIAKLNRDDSLRKDYPPHRHTNGKIMYPPDYPPGVTEQLQALAEP